MLHYGLQNFQDFQDFQDRRIWTPNSPLQRPKPEFLEERYEMFRKAS